MTYPLPLESDEVLKDIEHHFRVTAGPGAGKTHWLTKHIQHVARTSMRLTPCARIGVISYTNVAVREITRRLGTVADAVDASTIHSFLFRNLVRPYLHLLKEKSGQHLVAHHLVETHGEHYPAHNQLDSWLTVQNKRQLLISERKKSFELLKRRLQTLSVRIDAAGIPFFTPCKAEARDRPIQDLLSPDALLDYKQLYWQAGSVDHEDVLYFAYRLLREYPMLRRFLSARFPYLFIDEFQDTLPVQAAVVRWLADEGTIVGVIGDPEQAIYGFLDASASHFSEFQLNGHRTYVIAGNRRSTHAIVTFLNRIRTDGLIQRAIRPNSGAVPMVYGGNLADAVVHARAATSRPTELLILARKHDGVLRVRRAGDPCGIDPWATLQEADSVRCRFLNHVATAADLAQRGLYDIAIQRLVQGLSSRRGFRDPLQYAGTIDLVVRRSLALSLLEHVISLHERLLDQSALDFYNALHAQVPKCVNGLKKVRRWLPERSSTLQHPRVRTAT